MGFVLDREYVLVKSAGSESPCDAKSCSYYGVQGYGEHFPPIQFHAKLWAWWFMAAPFYLPIVVRHNKLVMANARYSFSVQVSIYNWKYNIFCVSPWYGAFGGLLWWELILKIKYQSFVKFTTTQPREREPLTFTNRCLVQLRARNGELSKTSFL